MDLKILSALKAWGDFEVIKRLEGGYRNTVILVKKGNINYVAKTTRRSEAALEWLECVYNFAVQAGFGVPEFIRTPDGALKHEGVSLERFMEGELITNSDLPALKEALTNFHLLTKEWPQRPSFASSQDLLTRSVGGDVDLSKMPQELVFACREAWQNLKNEEMSVIHGDLNASNIIKTKKGKYGLIDWDEARFDVSLFDCLALGQKATNCQKNDVFRRAALAWEIAVCWQIEASYARDLAKRFLAEGK